MGEQEEGCSMAVQWLSEGFESVLWAWLKVKHLVRART